MKSGADFISMTGRLSVYGEFIKASDTESSRIALHKQRNPRKAGTFKLIRLLFVMNCCGPNGMQGGVRGWRKSLILDHK